MWPSDSVLFVVRMEKFLISFVVLVFCINFGNCATLFDKNEQEQEQEQE